jgi:[ribosomal protein S5]-alanine N-acetyltransferase
MIPILETERLILRAFKDSDTQPLIAMNQDSKVMEFFPNCLSETESLAMLQRIEQQWATNGFGLWAVERKDTSAFIGFVGLIPTQFDIFFAPCVEIAWRLNKENWGQGLATEAALASLQYGFENLHLTEIYAFTAKINLRSERVMQKIGMVYLQDFAHPLVENNSPLQIHRLYRKL